MANFAVPTAIMLMCFVVHVTGCDLSYTCDGGVYYVMIQNQGTFTDASVDGCEIDKSSWDFEITIWNCAEESIELELISDDGENQFCPLSCGASGDIVLSRKRRAETELAPLSFVLTASGSSGMASYHCHSSGSVFIKNPRPELYLHSIASSLTDGSSCSTRHVLYNKIIEIYNCDTSQGMLFAMGSRSTVSYLITRQSNTLVLNCGQTPEPTDKGKNNGAKFECIEDGSITVTNPRRELFHHALATSATDGTDCDALFIDNYKKLIIHTRPSNGPLFLVLSRDPVTATMIIRPNNVFLINCP